MATFGAEDAALDADCEALTAAEPRAGVFEGAG